MNNLIHIPLILTDKSVDIRKMSFDLVQPDTGRDVLFGSSEQDSGKNNSEMFKTGVCKILFQFQNKLDKSLRKLYAPCKFHELLPPDYINGPIYLVNQR